jgi:hypothetical protein
MRRFLVLPALTLALATLLVRADDAKKSDLEPKVLDILKQVAAIHKDAKSMHVEATIVSDQVSDENKKHIDTEGIFDMETPNHFSLKTLKTKADGKAEPGPDLICDGKKMYLLDKGRKQYIEEDAVENLPDIGKKLPELQLPYTGMLFQNVLNENPYDALMEGVTACSYAGTEKVNGTEAHHLKFDQPGLKWELWVATTGKPVVLKALSNLEGGNGKATVVETYKNWKIDTPIAKDAFTFTPDAETKKVNAFRPNKE